MFDSLKKKFSDFVNSLKNEKEDTDQKGQGGKVVENQIAEQREEVRKGAQEENVQEEAKPEGRKGQEIEKETAAGEAHEEKRTGGVEEETGTHAENAAEIAESRQEGNSEEAKKPDLKEYAKNRERREERIIKPRLSFVTKLKKAVFKTIEIKDSDVEKLLEELKISLVQSDVNYSVAEKIVDSIRRNIVGAKISSDDLENGINSILKNSIMEILNRNPGVDVLEGARGKIARGEKPYKILFIGPNGAGKTTTIGKMARMFLTNNMSCVLSASDTFRAAAIEQTAYHANKLGVSVIKGIYGADPSSIAFDAVAYARAKGIDVVLIDSAGRQETNKNLIEEVKKMHRIAKPDLTVFVGESIAGNALLDQVRTFDQSVKLDGIILTKLDCDAKGGNSLSILSETTIPVLFFGVGEAYNALIPYRPELIIENIFSSSQ